MQIKYHMVTIEDLVPQDHFLRKLEAALDLSFVYKETERLYSHRYGRPPIDPVIMVKYLLVGYLYGIPSERKIEQRIQTDVALRWYLGIDLDERVPDHSTISQLRRRKPAFRKVFRRLFEKVVCQCVELGLVSGRLVVTDSTHVKANASRASEYLADVEEGPGAYWDRLDEYEEEGLEELKRKTGKPRGKRTKQVKNEKRRTKKRVSKTDPEAGYMKRPGKPRGQHYLCNQSNDALYGIITGMTVTSGDTHDSVPYLRHLEDVARLVPFQAAAADSAYDFGLAHRVLWDWGVDFFVRPQKSFDRTAAEFKKDDFRYDEERGSYICPNGKELKLRSLTRGAGNLSWVYRADAKDCQSCPLRGKCLSNEKARKLQPSYFEPAVRRDAERVDTAEYKEALKLRQIWCEGTFSVQKREHNLGRLQRRGLEAAEDHCLLSAVAINLKRMIRHMG